MTPIVHGTIAHIQDQLNAIQAELDAMKAGEREWPQIGDKVWWLRDYGAVHDIKWGDISIERNRLAFGVIFRTEAEATRERERRALIAELRRHPKACPNDGVWYLIWDHADSGWVWKSRYPQNDCCPASGYFSEKVSGLIEHYGERLDLLRS